MKKIIPFIFVIFILSGGTAKENAVSSEFLTHSSASLFGKSTEIHKLVESADYFINNILSYRDKKKIIKQKNAFKIKTGIDLLNSESLKENGIDISKTLSVAYFSKGEIVKKNSLLIFLPVLQPEKFPQRFVQIVQALTRKKQNNIDIKATSIEYKNHNIYKLKKNIYYTTIGNYFILSHSGELLKKTIELKELDIEEQSEESIASDELYVNYLEKKKNNFNVNVFVKKVFIKKVLTPLMNKKMKGALVDESDNADEFKILEANYNQNVEMIAASKKKSRKKRKKRRIVNVSKFLKLIDYASLGISFESGAFKGNILFNFLENDTSSDSFLNLINTGKYNSGITFDKAELYGLLSINPLVYESPEGKDVPGYTLYKKIKIVTRRNMGFDLGKDLLPYYEGVITGVLIKPKVMNYIGDYGIFISMNNEKKSNLLFAKMRKFFQRKYSRINGFGNQKVEKGKAFWFVDRKKKKIFIYSDGTGLFFGNDIKLIYSFARSKKISEEDPKHEIVQRMNENLFFLANLKKRSFLMRILKRLSHRNLRSILNKMGEIYIEGEKINRSLSFDLDVGLKIKKKKAEKKQAFNKK